MKKIILLLGVLMLMPFALAANENGKITAGSQLWITDVDVKVDDRTSRNLDYAEEISREAFPDSIIKLDIEVTNNHSSLSMQDVFIEATIDDLDLEDVSNEKDIGSASDTTFSIEFLLPSDVDDQTYEILILVEGELNNTLHKVEYELDLVVEIVQEETSRPSSVSSKIDDVSDTLGNLSREIGSYFAPYATCVSERKSFEEQVKARDATIITLRSFELKFNTCNTELIASNVASALRGDANQTCNLMIETVHLPKIKSQQNWGYIGAAIGAGVVFLFYWQRDRRKKEGTESEKEKKPDEDI